MQIFAPLALFYRSTIRRAHTSINPLIAIREDDYRGPEIWRLGLCSCEIRCGPLFSRNRREHSDIGAAVMGVRERELRLVTAYRSFFIGVASIARGDE